MREKAYSYDSIHYLAPCMAGMMISYRSKTVGYPFDAALNKTGRESMKHLPILLASLAIFACSGADSGGSADGAADATADGVAETADSSTGSVADGIDEAAAAMHDSMQKAEDVGAILEDEKDAIDAALDEAEGAATE